MQIHNMTRMMDLMEDSAISIQGITLALTQRRWWKMKQRVHSQCSHYYFLLKGIMDKIVGIQTEKSQLRS